MGITIHYRGKIDDLTRVEELENRVLDLAFALGGRATVWRSFADKDPSRVVRGLMLEMAPGQETFSLLISPEGYLTPLFQIEDAEKGVLDKPPYCSIKTQFGSIHGHVAVVHLLHELRQQYCSDLKVSDEGEFYETRDVRQLSRKMQFLGTAIKSMAEGLRNYGLSDEAAEDPNIIALRVERIAKLVHETMSGEPSTSPEHPATESDDEAWSEPSLEEEVEWMDRQRRKNDLRSERMTRRIAEATAGGMSADEAFELAMKEEGLSAPSTKTDTDALHSATLDESLETLFQVPNSYEEARETKFDETELGEHHPAVALAQSFLMSVMDLQKQQLSDNGFATTLLRSAIDIVGGLVQATSDELDDRVYRALAITQLKRAISGHAYARGAVFGLSREQAITRKTATEFQERLTTLLNALHDLMSNAWDVQTW